MDNNIMDSMVVLSCFFLLFFVFVCHQFPRCSRFAVRPFRVNPVCSRRVQLGWKYSLEKSEPHNSMLLSFAQWKHGLSDTKIGVAMNVACLLITELHQGKSGN